MSDKKLNECREERDKLRVQVAELSKLLDTPEHKAVKAHCERFKESEDILHFEMLLDCQKQSDEESSYE